MSTWLENLDHGITRLYVSAGMGRSVSVRRVRTAGKIHISIDCGHYLTKFRKSDGHSTCSGYFLPSIEEATPERIAQVRAKTERLNIAHGLENTKWVSLPIETLRAVEEVLRAGKQEESDGG